MWKWLALFWYLLESKGINIIQTGVNFYFSIEKVPKITSPVLVIHGTEDNVVDFSHGLAIHEKCPRAVEPLWVEVRIVIVLDLIVQSLVF